MTKKPRRKYKRENTLSLLSIDSLTHIEKSGRAAVVDISIGGAAFESSVEFEKGEKVVLRFTGEWDRIQIIEGIITRVENRIGVYVHGVEFTDKGFFNNLRIKKLISKLKKTN